MEFYSRSNKAPVEPSPSGAEIIPTFSLVIDKETGKKELKATGKTNIYEEIQAHKEECLIYNILERYAMGDESVLNEKQGIFADISNVPKSLNEAQEMILNAENVFNELPVEFRAEFNHSITEFIASVSNGTFEQKLSKHVVKPEVPDIQPTDIVAPVEQTQPVQQSQNQTPISNGVNLGGNI